MNLRVKFTDTLDLTVSKADKEKLSKVKAGDIFQAKLKPEIVNRSLEQLNLYFRYCQWFSENCPEVMSKALDDIGIGLSKDMVHIIFKQLADIDSISFDRLSPSEFTEYFDKCLNWGALKIGCTVEDIKYALYDNT